MINSQTVPGFDSGHLPLGELNHLKYSLYDRFEKVDGLSGLVTVSDSSFDKKVLQTVGP